MQTTPEKEQKHVQHTYLRALVACLLMFNVIRLGSALLKSPFRLETSMSLKNVSSVTTTQNSTNSSSVHNESSSPQKINSTSSTRTMNLLYGLSGNLTGFMDEFEVSLKSVLLNSPLDYDLAIHLIVDELAHVAASHRILQTANLEGSLWRNNITIQFYPVQMATARRWIQEKITAALPGKSLDARITIGGYFRMFADELLPRGLGNLIYLDNDVVIMANLQDFWRSFEATNTFNEQRFMYHNGCSGFMVIDFDRFHIFWRYLPQIPLERIDNAGDQHLIGLVSHFFANTTGQLPPE